ncbi:MAG: 2-oxoglutarate dehydrogenase E1 component [Alphaproteobacteria bacterium]
MDNDLTNSDLLNTSFLDGANATYLQKLQDQYQQNPHSVDPEVQAFFEKLGDSADDVHHAADAAPWRRKDAVVRGDTSLLADLGDFAAIEQVIEQKIAAREPAKNVQDIRAQVLDSIRAIMMIRAYRVRGHFKAKLDPLGLEQEGQHEELMPSSYGFGPEDMDREIYLDFVLGLETATINEMVALLERTYCSTLGVEFMHISDPAQKAWIQERIEGRDKEIHFTPEGKKAILNKLVEAEGFEKFLHVKYTGTKRFGLDGGEALIPALEQIIKRGGNLGVREVVLGMPHRGRLNVLANVMGKPYRAILNEFQGGSFKPEEIGGSGDVKYHLGSSSDREFDGNVVHLSLAANPSHLEAVDPVVLGKARAKQDRYDRDRSQVIPVLMHGDAAFAGQGIVAECLGLSGLAGYKSGGTIHLIVNNQIGFTTAPKYSRSSRYPCDVAKMVDAPIFHVNGDDPEAVVHAAKVATEFRQQFGKDVVVDMFCYRRFGHNEGDEPSFTQPIMYRKIRRQPTTAEIYGSRLVAEGLISETELTATKEAFQDLMAAEFDAAQGYRPNAADWLQGKWKKMRVAEDGDRRGHTPVDLENLKSLGRSLTAIPDGFEAHRTVKRLLETKKRMFETGEGFDWATAEALAFATLLDEGFNVRLSGQDSCRGTFSQRHSKLVDQNTEEDYFPLAHLHDKQGRFEVIDSMLSEYAVLGFEYGYSWEEPNSLTMWEAQFGDFANGAQVIVDQFVASAETKWLRMSGLVMLLPHGYEGQGPEHSSARLERYLQMCAEDNIQVANCTTPANYFHILRRQMMRDFRKPLVLMTPKSLLRHRRCTSTLQEMGPGTSFHRLLDDDAQRGQSSTKLVADKKIKRLVLCTGKVYYDLLEAREAANIDDVYLLRVEQLYPVPTIALQKELARFPDAEVIWCQEEPKNMGAWSFIDPYLEECLADVKHACARAKFVGRKASASTATGLLSVHKLEQEALVSEALGLKN